MRTSTKSVLAAVAAFLAATTTALPTAAQGTLRIDNFLHDPVYLQNTCGATSITSMIIAPGQYVIVPFPAPGTANACSAKMNSQGHIPEGAPVMQYEYSTNERGEVWWNLSAQDGNPFLAQGSGAVTWGGSSATVGCPRSITCIPGSDRECSFQGRNAGGPTYRCSVDTNLQFYLGVGWGDMLD